MIEREPGVSLAATGGRFQLHHRRFPCAVHATDRRNQQPVHAGRQVGTPEELDRFAVFGTRMPGAHVYQIRRELGLLLTPGPHIGMGATMWRQGANIGML